MNLSTKLRRSGIEVNPGGKKAAMETNGRNVPNKHNPCYTKKWTLSRIKEYLMGKK